MVGIIITEILIISINGGFYFFKNIPIKEKNSFP